MSAGAAGIDVFWIRRDDAIASCEDADRVERDRLRCPRARQRFLSSRAAIRRILAQRLAIAPSAIELRRDAFGRLECPACPDLGLSLAHAEDWSLLALGRGRAVGVDCERQRQLPDFAALTARTLSAEESARLCGRAATLDAFYRDTFYRIWTRKEALAKGLGLGLALPFRRVTVWDDDARSGAEVVHDGVPWRITDLAAPPGYSAACAIAPARR